MYENLIHSTNEITILLNKDKIDFNELTQKITILNHQLSRYKDKTIEKLIPYYDKLNEFIFACAQGKQDINRYKETLVNRYIKIKLYLENLNTPKNRKKGFIAGVLLMGLGALATFSVFDKKEVPKEKLAPQVAIEQVQQVMPVPEPTQTEIQPEIKVEPKDQQNNYETDPRLSEINPKFYDNQKIQMLKFIDNFQIDYGYLKSIEFDKLLSKKTLTPTKFNPNLTKALKKLAKNEDVNLKWIIYFTIVESTYGKNNRSDSAGALGPLQAMPETMKENCYEDYIYSIRKATNEFKKQNPDITDEEVIKQKGFEKGEEIFYADLYIRLKAGMRELKKIAKAYSIDISYDSSEISEYDSILISSSYHQGIGNFRKNPQRINNAENDGFKYVRKLVTLQRIVDKII